MSLLPYLDGPSQPDIEPVVCLLNQLLCCHTLARIDDYPNVGCCLLQRIHSTPVLLQNQHSRYTQQPMQPWSG